MAARTRHRALFAVRFGDGILLARQCGMSDDSVLVIEDHPEGMLLVGEGVETSAERDTLVELGCPLLQGYLHAKPGRPFPDFRW